MNILQELIHQSIYYYLNNYDESINLRLICRYQAFFEMDEKTIDVKEDGSVHFTANEKHGGFAGSEATGNTKNFIAKKVGDVYEISEN